MTCINYVYVVQFIISGKLAYNEDTFITMKMPSSILFYRHQCVIRKAVRANHHDKGITRKKESGHAIHWHFSDQ